MLGREALLRLVGGLGPRRGVAFTVGVDVWRIFAACGRARRETKWSAKVEVEEIAAATSPSKNQQKG